MAALVLFVLMVFVLVGDAFAANRRCGQRGLCAHRRSAGVRQYACPSSCQIRPSGQLSCQSKSSEPAPGEAVVEEKAKDRDEKTSAGIEIVFATEFTDGGTYGARLKYPTGEELSFCVSTPDGFSRKWLPSRLYMDVMHPTQPGARLVPLGSDEELTVIRDLEKALAPHLTEEGKRLREQLPKENFLGRYWQLGCAEGLLARLYEVTGRKPDGTEKGEAVQLKED